MPAYRVERSIQIQKQPGELIDYLSDFQTWPKWSPWLIMEPDCKVTYHGTQGQIGAGYHWEGVMVGEGKMTLLEKTDKFLLVDLEFIKPFKSLAKAGFSVTPSENGSLVTWTLDAKLPWFLFFMKSMMESQLGMDYDRGLKMLKSLIETGDILSQLDLVGSKEEELTHYVALEGTANIEELSKMIPDHYGKLHQYFIEKSIAGAGVPFTLYYDMDMKTSVCHVRNAFPVSEPVEVKPPFICDSIPKSDTYQVKHTGEYKFVGNAWAFAFFAARHNKVKVKKSPVGFERYPNDPAETQPKDLISEVVLFKK